MQYIDQVDNILESIFSSYFDYDVRNPEKNFNDWAKNKNPRKKFKTLKLYNEQNGLCYHCSKLMRYDVADKHPDKTSLDRVLPGSKGGGYEIDNLVLSCNLCNKQRGDKSIKEYNDWKETSLNLSNSKV